MSVTSVYQIWDGRDGEISIDGEQYSRVFRVTTDNKFDGQATVIAGVVATAGINIGSLFLAGSTARLQRFDARQESFSPYVWLVTASYATSVIDFDPTTPENDTPEIEWSTDLYQHPYFFDSSGEGLVNSAGDFFVDGTEGDDQRLNVNITFSSLVVPTWFLNYRNTVNDAGVTIDGFAISAGQGKIQSLRVSPTKYRNGTSYRTVQVQVGLRAEGWDLSLLDRGLHEKDGTDRKRIVLDDGTDATEPVLLDGSGARLADPGPSNAVTVSYSIYGTSDFTVIPGIV